MRLLATIAFALGAGIAAMFACMAGAEWLRWRTPFWYDGEVIEGAAFFGALIAAPATAWSVDRAYRKVGRWPKVLLLGSGLGVLASALVFYLALVF